jgi:hypothetical protein
LLFVGHIELEVAFDHRKYDPLDVIEQLHALVFEFCLIRIVGGDDRTQKGAWLFRPEFVLLSLFRSRIGDIGCVVVERFLLALFSIGRQCLAL